MLRILNIACYTLCICCVAVSVVLALVMIWTDFDFWWSWRVFASAAVLMTASLVALMLIRLGKTGGSGVD